MSKNPRILEQPSRTQEVHINFMRGWTRELGELCSYWVEAQVLVPIGRNTFAHYSLRSTGRSGIAFNCDQDEANEIWRNEEAELRNALRQMADAFIKLA